MKKMFLVAVVLFFAASAWATPIYQGDPVSTLGEGASLPSVQNSGYYIWANDASRSSWSVRWTSVGVSADWEGEVSYTTNIGEVQTLSWDAPGIQDTIEFDDNALSGDDIEFSAWTNGQGWDGFDFTLLGEVGDYLTFELSSSVFNSQNSNMGVYLGQDFEFVLDNVDTTAFFTGANGQQRQFEVAAPVPEPGTLLLLGSGLVGLAFLKRRKS